MEMYFIDCSHESRKKTVHSTYCFDTEKEQTEFAAKLCECSNVDRVATYKALIIAKDMKYLKGF